MTTNKPAMIGHLEKPPFQHQAALYFLDGQYLFRSFADGAERSKFVTARDVAAAFSGVEQDSDWLPAGIVRVGHGAKGNWFVYSAPEQRIEILFDGEDQPVSIPIPRTVLLGVGMEYHLWALKSESFERDAKACSAPFPNTYDNGHICWGDNAPGVAEVTRARKTWKLFFSTPFNGHLTSDKSKAHPADVRETLRQLAGEADYPYDDLVESRNSIAETINRTLGVK